MDGRRLEEKYDAPDNQVSIIVPTVLMDEKDGVVPRKSVLMHFNDPNYPVDSKLLNDAESTHGSTYASDSFTATPDFDDDSPYPEVRAAVSRFDDPKMPVNTFRAWLLGIITCLLISGINQFYFMRYPSVYISSVVAMLLTLPAGKLLERILPTTTFRTFRYTWSLNPGPFSIKEHVVITVMANIAADGAYASDIIATQRLYYGQIPPYSYQLCISLSMQLIGYSLAGFLRPFLVWPAAMIWPSALVNSAVLNTLNQTYRKKENKHIHRHKFFFITVACSFLWYWVPGYLWTGLSQFNWACWIAPNNVVVNQLFGTATGLGMGLVTLDWTMIAATASPLVTPWWAQANILAAFVLMVWILVPALYYTNTWFTAYLPISSYLPFDNTGNQYNATAIFTNGAFDLEKYKAYSPVYLPAVVVLVFASSFASTTAVISHTILWHRRDILSRFWSNSKSERDIHSRLMQAYPEVPRSWYILVGLFSLILGVAGIEIMDTKLPIWGFLLIVGLSGLLLLPIGILYAITNYRVGLHVIAEFLGGYMFPEKPIANMLVKGFAYVTNYQGLTFVGDLKLGHYMKVPPRIMFAAQVIATVLGCINVVFIQSWMFHSIPDLCSRHQKDGFICRGTNTFATSSLVWGGVGPKRLFSPGALYSSTLWFFFVGAITPIPFYFLARRFPFSNWRYVNIPVCFAGLMDLLPNAGINYSSWAITGFIFQFIIRRYRFRWWLRNNYILSGGLDAGVAIGFVVIFLTLQSYKNPPELNWWGNTVWINTADAAGTPLKSLQPGETFGFKTWS